MSDVAKTKCARCGESINTDLWGRWVDRWLWLTCGGDRPHEPVTSAPA
ncbi:hypothetical protein [Micromonospora orduensis]